MDFSLLQPHAHTWLLRDITALKSRWVYYVIMVLDPILRFSWVGIAIYTHNTQHSTVVSFTVALFEVVRRGMWALIRVENEHCANVAQYKASRDVPRPYHFEPAVDEEPRPGTADTAELGATPLVASEGAADEEVVAKPGWAHRTDTTRSFSKILAAAHTQDFEKRRKVEAVPAVDEEEDEPSDEEDDDGAGMVSRGSSGTDNESNSHGAR